MPEIAENTIIDGRYRVLQQIGSGGMADVYLAEDEHLGRKVALKLLHRRFSQDKEFVERFRREASAAAGLQHPHVVGVYDRGEFDGTYYIAMEYCPGETLKELIVREAPLDPARAISIARQMLIAARFAHKRGVIHRDLKPQNVILDSDDNVKVADFGIARSEASDITEVGAIMGTAQYLSPEQAQGTDVTSASDLYSIGVVLYEMLTAHAPFEGDSAVAVALKHVNENPRPPHQFVPVAPALEAVVVKSLAKDGDARYATADAFIADLDAAETRLDEPSLDPQSTARFTPVPVPVPLGAEDANGTGESEAVSGEVVDAYPLPGELSPEEQRRRRRRNWLIVGGVAGAVVLVILAFLLLRTPEQVEIPAVQGRTLDSARQALELAGFKVDIRQRPDVAAKDIVIDQVPGPGQKADRGSTVTITVSSGPTTVKVPDVIGLSRSDARERMRRAGLRPNFRQENSTEVDQGLVIRTDPSASFSIERGSAVTVFLSSGAKQVAVPDVVGLGQDEARQRLDDEGFSVVVEQQSSSETKDTVISQSPGGGQEVDEGSTVTITVSRGDRKEVPGVVGLSENQATAQIERAGFSVSTRTRSVTNPDEDGIVLSQSPAAGAERSEGSTVTLTVGDATPAADGGSSP